MAKKKSIRVDFVKSCITYNKLNMIAKIVSDYVLIAFAMLLMANSQFRPGDHQERSLPRNVLQNAILYL